MVKLILHVNEVIEQATEHYDEESIEIASPQTENVDFVH